MDKDAVKAKVRVFVEQYNSTVDFVRSKLWSRRSRTPRPTLSASRDAEGRPAAVSFIVGGLRSTMRRRSRGNPRSSTSSWSWGSPPAPRRPRARSRPTPWPASSCSTRASSTRRSPATWRASSDCSPATARWPGSASGSRTSSSRARTPGAIDERIKTLDSEVARIRTAMAEIDRRLANKENGPAAAVRRHGARPRGQPVAAGLPLLAALRASVLGSLNLLPPAAWPI